MQPFKNLVFSDHQIEIPSEIISHVIFLFPAYTVTHKQSLGIKNGSIFFEKMFRRWGGDYKN